MELYFSTDVEADGPIPGPHSMLSFASAAFKLQGDPSRPSGYELLSTFTRNLALLPGATGHPRTMAWWKKNPEAYEATRERPIPPDAAMPQYAQWVKGLASEHDARPVFVAYPATYDFLFVYWYLIRFAGESPFSHSGCDIKSYAMAVLGSGYRDAAKRNMPKRWFGKARHSHVALDDAIEQGELFCRMVIEHRHARSSVNTA